MFGDVARGESWGREIGEAWGREIRDAGTWGREIGNVETGTQGCEFGDGGFITEKRENLTVNR